MTWAEKKVFENKRKFESETKRDLKQAVDPRYSCRALMDSDFVDVYHRRWGTSKHLISPIFKD